MNRPFSLSIILSVLLLIAGGCAHDKQPSIRIAVSANAEPLASALMQEFKADPPLASELMLGSSGQLSAQIANGAPVDIFLAADTNYPQFLFSEGIGQEPPKVYAEGVLVLISKDSTPSLSMLRSENVERIAIAKPDLAPYGKASKEFLQQTDNWELLRDKFIYAENALQSAIFTNAKAVDLGFGAQSIAMNLSKKTEIYWTVVDSSKYSPIRQAALLLKREGQSPQVKAFYDFIFSPEGQAIIASHGYKLVD